MFPTLAGGGDTFRYQCSLCTGAIPAAATGLSLSFWHDYTFEEAGRDGGVLEFAGRRQARFDVTDSGSGAVFASNGYAQPNYM